MNSRCIENEMQPDYQQMNQGVDSCAVPCPPIYECPMTRVCERVIVHEVPQV
ncbi:MAG: hypothetical protein OSJ65_06125 [Bacilli bacterium]|nr:hypothetical protein [Bacilli bacterium]